MTTKVQTVVVGAGVVGLSIARLLTRAGREVVLVDKAARAVTGTSSRNSGVIHAGLYYERGSLKASTCVEGSWMLHKLCDMYKVPVNRCGKLVVATTKSQDAKLERIYMRALGLGARDLVLLNGSDALRFEPSLTPKTVGAIWSPHTAVVDQVALGEALLKDCADSGKDRFLFAPKSDVVDIEYGNGEFKVAFADGSNLTCKELINAAGLYARDVSSLMKRNSASLIPESKLPRISYYKGSYFTLKQRSLCPFDRLIYPTRESGHLGVHLTMDTEGNVRLGPDNERIDIGGSLPKNLEASGVLKVDPMRAMAFREAVADYWPDVPEMDELEPDFAGIRPKTEHGDFIMDQHAIPGYVSLYGIDSPGLTAALSLAHRVGDLLGIRGVTTPEMKSSHVYEWEK
jgi:L-2-hydroxyglutarate oxidase LhgO